MDGNHQNSMTGINDASFNGKSFHVALTISHYAKANKTSMTPKLNSIANN